MVNGVVMDFYDKLRLYKSKENLKWETIGEYISMNGPAIRMAVKRKSLSDLEKKELNSVLDIDLNNTYSGRIESDISVNDNEQLYQTLDKNLYNQILQNSIKNIEESAKATLDSIKIIKDLLK